MVSGEAAYNARYATWDSAKGLVAKVGAFVEGSANFLMALGFGQAFARALMGVFVASFAATTLDTACRLQRYVIQELAGTLLRGRTVTAPKPGVALSANPLSWLTNKHGATIFAVLLAFLVAYIPAPPKVPGDPGVPGTGGLNLWPLFGATNQLLGGLAFLVILFWMRRRGLPVWFVAIPACFMLILPGLAMSIELFRADGWISKGNYLLVGIGIATLILELWMIVEALIAWPKAKGVLEESLPPLKPAAAEMEGGRSC